MGRLDFASYYYLIFYVMCNILYCIAGRVLACDAMPTLLDVCWQVLQAASVTGKFQRRQVLVSRVTCIVIFFGQ